MIRAPVFAEADKVCEGTFNCVDDAIVVVDVVGDPSLMSNATILESTMCSVVKVFFSSSLCSLPKICKY